MGNWLQNKPDNKFLNGKGFALITGAVSGGVGSVLGGGNFWMGAGQGLIVTAFNFLAHQIIKPKFVVAGIYGAGGDEAGDNPISVPNHQSRWRGFAIRAFKQTFANKIKHFFFVEY